MRNLPKSDDIVIKLSSESICINAQITKKYYQGKLISGSTLTDRNTRSIPKIDKLVKTIISKKIWSEKLGVPIKDIESPSSEKKPRLISTRTSRKIRNKLTAFVSHFRHKQHNHPFVFYTLTLNSKNKNSHSDCNKMLNTWLTRMRKYVKENQNKTLNYLWVNELQENGQIHYHIMINQQINIKHSNYFWLKILQNNGYDIQDNANPVDIRNKTYLSIDKLARYMTKYVTKDKSEIFAQRWNCSSYISKLPTAIYMIIKHNDFHKLLDLQHYKNKKGEVIHVPPLIDEQKGFVFQHLVNKTAILKNNLKWLYSLKINQDLAAITY